MVEEGEVLNDDPVEIPFHVYEDAPEATSVAISIGHIDTLDTVMVGFGINWIEIVFDAEQFKLSIAVIV